jgi:hypothetical protein
MWARIWSVGSPAIATRRSPSSSIETAANASTPARALRALFHREIVVITIPPSTHMISSPGL